MNRNIRLLALILGLLASACSQRPLVQTPARQRPATQPSQPPRVVFGAVEETRSGIVVRPCTNMPLLLGAKYGWRLLLPEGHSFTRIREELTMPRAPKTWTDDRNLKISNGGRTGTIEINVAGAHGMIGHTTIIEDGDPVGTYRLRLSGDDQWAAEFHFQLTEPSVAEPTAAEPKKAQEVFMSEWKVPPSYFDGYVPRKKPEVPDPASEGKIICKGRVFEKGDFMMYSRASSAFVIVSSSPYYAKCKKILDAPESRQKHRRFLDFLYEIDYPGL